jgi:putative phosphoesterase
MKQHYQEITLKNNKARVTLAIISDTHGVLDARCANEVARCDVVLHAGDVCGHHIIQELSRLCDQVIVVAGNNDMTTSINGRGALTALPQAILLGLPGGHLVMEHGHKHGNNPSHNDLRARWSDARVIVYGHTHKQVWDKETIPWIINPGAAGETRTRGGASCAILTASKETWSIELKRFPNEDIRVA